MNVSSPPQLPSSFDPAIHLHSEQDQHRDAPLLTSSHSDEFEALNQLLAESTAAKNKQGIVIQHRAWRVPEVFRSEEDHAIDTPSKRRVRYHAPLPALEPSQSVESLPSSPPTLTMPFISSPVTYPATSPPTPESPRKRRKIEPQRIPLKRLSANGGARLVGGFLDEDSDDDEDVTPKQISFKRKTTSNVDVVQSMHQDRAQVENNDMLCAITEEHVNLIDEDEQDLSRHRTAEAPTNPESVEDLSQPSNKPLSITTCSGRIFYIGQRCVAPTTTYEQLIAARSTAALSGARKSYYGIDIHQLMDDAARETEEAVKAQQQPADAPILSVEETTTAQTHTKPGRTLMWTEKYRARKFTDLIGDERTHRSVLRWLKGWDPIVFPGSGRPKPKASKHQADTSEERAHRKILLLAGPPGLGKTTLAHVCAKQAGYEVQEINASDERSRDVVKGRIRDMVGTENVRGVDTKTADGKVRKAGRPVCVVVDEVDGVVTGTSSGGEGGFIKALIDLVMLDQKNSHFVASSSTTTSAKKKKGDKFRLLRPLILICNDIYHPSLRPLRQSSIAEIIHIRKPPLNMVVSRMHSIFEKEGVPCDADGVRRLCEATWGVSTRKEGGSGNGAAEGDIRGVVVIGEWVASKLRASINSCLPGTARLTRRWIEENLLGDLADGGGAARSLGRGGAKEVVERVFLEGAGFPKGTVSAQSQKLDGGSSGPIGVAEASKRRAMERLREMIDTTGESDRIITDCFTAYPTRPYQDDTFLSKPSAACDWLHFHDSLSAAVYGSQDWELAPYLSQSVLAFHHLFASPATAAAHHSILSTSTAKPKFSSDDLSADAEEEPSPFAGPSAPFLAAEALKHNRAALQSLQATLALPLARTYRAPEVLATELLPYVLRMLAPDVKPVLVHTSSSASAASGSQKDGGWKGGSSSTASVRKASEKALVGRAVNCMAATGVRFERARVEGERVSGGVVGSGWVYRMEPPLDALGAFQTAGWRRDDRVRYAVRQVLEMEWVRESKRREEEGRKRRFQGGGELGPRRYFCASML